MCDISAILYVCRFVVLTASFRTSYVKCCEGVNIIDIFTLKNVGFHAKKELLREVLIHNF